MWGDRYTIERYLGEGGLGITYLARNQSCDRVVIKTLKEQVLNDPKLAAYREKYQQDFREEALRLALCRHPHIVQIENAFYEEQLPCMAMEYVEGENLWQQVGRQREYTDVYSLAAIVLYWWEKFIKTGSDSFLQNY